MARQAGKFVWFEHLSSDPGRAQRFHGEVFGDRAETGLGGLGGAARWVGFGLVWVALTILTIDSIRHARTSRGVSDLGELT